MFSFCIASAKVLKFIESLIEKSGIVKELEAEKTIENQSRIENIKEFISVAREFEITTEEKPTLEDFLAHISLVADIDDTEEIGDRIVMMTLHSAKGLEFPIVFIAGMEEGIFPSYRSISEESKLEEERRLCYVGITRAQKDLYITNAQSRMLFGSTSYNLESRFIKEIPDDLINVKENPSAQARGNTYGKQGSSFKGFGKAVDLSDLKARIKEFNEITASSEVNIGDRVMHKKFGEGIIKSKVDEGSDHRLDIEFDDYGTKRLMESYAKLKRI